MLIRVSGLKPTLLFQDLPAGGDVEVDLENLKAPDNLPCGEEMGLLVIVIDPYNITKDVNVTNNVALLPIGLSCESSEYPWLVFLK